MFALKSQKLSLLHSERPKMYTILVFLGAIGLNTQRNYPLYGTGKFLFVHNKNINNLVDSHRNCPNYHLNLPLCLHYMYVLTSLQFIHCLLLKSYQLRVLQGILRHHIVPLTTLLQGQKCQTKRCNPTSDCSLLGCALLARQPFVLLRLLKRASGGVSYFKVGKIHKGS